MHVHGVCLVSCPACVMRQARRQKEKASEREGLPATWAGANLFGRRCPGGSSSNLGRSPRSVARIRPGWRASAPLPLPADVSPFPSQSPCQSPGSTGGAAKPQRLRGLAGMCAAILRCLFWHHP
ncbi:hypothetical protein [Azospirillum doebereinerae]